ncbi:hypothetical protein ACQEVB_04380 [Pseudonocardia sp. CA-107938]|uniref:hypothetical protein n=1 Tax=Pseudonocardia sp. CA-107938 TaxID=3240021 RepID=UPI003D913BDC
MPLPRRAAATIVLAALAVVVALLAGFSLLDPFHLRHARWFSLALIAVAIVLVTATFAVPVRGFLRGFVVALGVVAVAGWGAVVWVAVGFATENAELSTVVDGGRRLVVLEGGPHAADRVISVVVRSGGGPFEQQSVVYQGRAGGPGVTDAHFERDAVLVQAGPCRYRSVVDDLTLEVRPVHAPLAATSC